MHDVKHNANCFFFFNDKTEKKDKSGNFISSHPTENQVTTFISCGLFTGPRATIFLVETLNGRTLYFLSATCDVSLTQWYVHQHLPSQSGVIFNGCLVFPVRVAHTSLTSGHWGCFQFAIDSARVSIPTNTPSPPCLPYMQSCWVKGRQVARDRKGEKEAEMERDEKKQSEVEEETGRRNLQGVKSNYLRHHGPDNLATKIQAKKWLSDLGTHPTDTVVDEVRMLCARTSMGLLFLKSKKWEAT